MKTLQRGLPASRYNEYMKSAEWAANRAWWKSHHTPRRQRCRARGFGGCSGVREMHHRTYERLGCERLSDLVPLCERHHKGTHRLERALMVLLGAGRPVALRWATRLYVGAHRRLTWALAVVLVLLTLA